ncbi:VQ motif-containing protein 31-like [Macadamia integrifolia]|uniref:VQ motif-containing protein 31-like n=1 Tax=Macadamia integrifolia TaxID=60698 RepID=UPI001C4E910B|nr:VQ motif-containing protein 31-like [Macadamia integrifolia]
MIFFPLFVSLLIFLCLSICIMATNNNNNNNRVSFPSGSDSVSSHTTFVQADPSTFRAVVQKLTGATDDPSLKKLPVTVPARQTGKGLFGEVGTRKPAFKLQERRQNLRKLEIKLEAAGFVGGCGSGGPYSPSAMAAAAARQRTLIGGVGEMTLVSPVSPFDLFSRGSPRTPTPRLTPEEEEDKAIAEKCFYLHPSPTTTPRSSEPELLPLFPLHSPRDSTTTTTTSPPPP